MGNYNIPFTGPGRLSKKDIPIQIPPFLIIMVGFGLALFSAYHIGKGNNEMAALPPAGVLGLVVTLYILSNPLLGLSLTVGSTLLIEILPTTTYISSITVLLGAITFVSYIVQVRFENRSSSVQDTLRSLHIIEITALVFINWIFGNSPQSALGMTGTRNWLFTFVQLFILLHISSRLLNTPPRHRIFMLFFIIFVLISSSFGIHKAITQGISNVERASGLGENPNALAFQATLGILFAQHIARTTSDKQMRNFALISFAIFVITVLLTLSRSGLVTMIIVVLISNVSPQHGTQQLQRVILISSIIAAILFTFSGSLVKSFASRFEESDETRFAVWDASFKVFLDHPISGVGIGNGSKYTPFYSEELMQRSERKGQVTTSHNSILSLLSETGTVGLAIFLAMLFAAFQALVSAINRYRNNPEYFSLAITWLAVLLIYFMQGLLHSVQYDKVFWLTIGVALGFEIISKNAPAEPEETPIPDNPVQQRIALPGQEP